jgi:hypothetical protein
MLHANFECIRENSLTTRFGVHSTESFDSQRFRERKRLLRSG